jgi:hypothetical protein
MLLNRVQPDHDYPRSGFADRRGHAWVSCSMGALGTCLYRGCNALQEEACNCDSAQDMLNIIWRMLFLLFGTLSCTHKLQLQLFVAGMATGILQQPQKRFSKQSRIPAREKPETIKYSSLRAWLLTDECQSNRRCR